MLHEYFSIPYEFSSKQNVCIFKRKLSFLVSHSTHTYVVCFHVLASIFSPFTFFYTNRCYTTPSYYVDCISMIEGKKILKVFWKSYFTIFRFCFLLFVFIAFFFLSYVQFPTWEMLNKWHFEMEDDLRTILLKMIFNVKFDKLCRWPLNKLREILPSFEMNILRRISVPLVICFFRRVDK